MRHKKSVLIDENILIDMLDVGTLQPLLESFGQICGTGSGIFTPSGVRIGKPAHHSPFCSLLYETKEGRDRCSKCDNAKIKQIRRGEIIEPYKCHAGLIDFCEPIFIRVGRVQRLIGVFFAGQVLYEEDEVTDECIRDLMKVAHDCKVDSHKLMARYMQVPRLPHKKVDEIRMWMKQFTNLIGLLVQKKAATQELLLDVIRSADDPNAIMEAIQRHLKPAAVSIFLKRDDVPDNFRNRIFLVATTFKGLMSHLVIGVDRKNVDKIAYESGEGFTGWVYKTGQVLHVTDVWDEANYTYDPYPPVWKHKIQEVSRLDAAQAFLGVPIRGDGGEIIGVIRAVRLKGHPGFKNEEIELVTGIASLVGVATAKAQLHKRHAEKIEALNQAQALLGTLTEPGTNLHSITRSMVEQLGEIYVEKGKWEAVYVLQHLRSSKQFQFVASFPSNLADEYKGEPFPDTKGVSGYILYKKRKTFASANCHRDGVQPTTPWTSVVCAPIFHEDKMWGAVSLCCEQELSQTEVDLAAPKITQFAQDMSLVCRLSEILDVKNATTVIASNVLSMNLEAHELYKSLESAKIAIDNLCVKVQGEEREIAEDLAKEIDDSLSWADVCLELGRYIKLCQEKPDAAIKMFRSKHLPIWELMGEVNIAKVAEKALNGVKDMATTYHVKIATHFRDVASIIGDENLLYRAFRNLLENAIIHGSEVKGEKIKSRENMSVSFYVTSNNNVTKIVVRDNGEGMDSETLAASKEAYANPTLLGSTSLVPGFGTMIVAFTIAVHLGRISVDSEVGKGTCVSLEIPSFKRTEN